MCVVSLWYQGRCEVMLNVLRKWGIHIFLLI